MTMKKSLIVYLLAIFFIIPLFISCGKSVITDSDGKPVNIELVADPQISWVLRRENGIDADVVYGDLNYAVVDEKWFINEVIGGFGNFLKKNGIDNYNALNNDCDDYARAFSFYCRVKFRQLGYKASMAVGDFYYRTPYDNSALLGGGHAMNVGIFLDTNGKKVVRLIEPQIPVRIYPVTHLDEETLKYYVNHIGM